VHDWRYVDVDGIRTRYREHGSGDPIVLIHGGEIAAGSADAWPPQLLELLGAEHRVIAYDRLGSGYTDNPRSDDEFSMRAVVDHTAAFLREIGVDSATVVGQSRGAYVALRLAKVHPELVQRLVLINSASVSARFPAEPVPSMRNYGVYYEQFTGDADHDSRLMSVTVDHITPEWAGARQQIAELDKTRDAKATFARLWESFFREFEIDKGETLKWVIRGGHDKPTLLLWGIGDPTTTLDDAVELFTLMQPHIDELRMHVINRSGHWPHREYPLEIGAEIRDFVARTTQTAHTEQEES